MKTAITALLAGALLAGCKGQSEKEFVSGCRSGGTPRSVCSCIYDELEDTLKAGAKDRSLLRGAALEKAMIDAAKTCTQ